MAEQTDLELLKSGRLDLASFVLDGADLSGMDLRDRDFRYAHLQGTQFVNANLVGATFSQTKHTNANFQGANLSGVSFDHVNFGLNLSHANLAGCKFSGILTRCNFDNSNLCGADFGSADIHEGCSFADVMFDRATSFEKTKALRPYLKFAVLADYEIERGILKRVMQTDGPALSKAATDAVAALTEGLRVLSQVPIEFGLSAHIGHNMPPAEFRILKEERDASLTELEAARSSIVSGEMNSSVIKAAIKRVVSIGAAALSWIATKVDLAAVEFSKSLGSTLGSKTAGVFATLYLSGMMESIASFLRLLIP